MKRSLVALLSLGACATTSVAATSPEALRGCWIERRGEETLTMRWFPDRDHPGAWRGDWMLYTPGQEPAHQEYRLIAGADGLEVCPQDEPHGPPCKPAYINDSPAADDGEWFSLQADAETLRLDFVVGLDSMVLFNGARDGCD